MTVRRASPGLAVCLGLALAAAVSGQSPPPTPLRLLTPQGSRPLPSLIVGDNEMIALDELALVFPIKIRDDAATRSIAVTWKGKTAVLTPEQALASVGGRLVSLPAPPVKIGGKWFVPVEFIARALALIADGPLEFRKPSRLVIAGGVRIPRVAVRFDVPSPQARVTFDISPPTPHTIVQEATRLVVRFEADALDANIAAFAPQGFVQSIHPTESGTGIALELGPRFASFRGSDVPASAGSARLLIDIYPATEVPPTAAAPGAPPVPATPEAPVLPLPAPGVRVIVIDPGHGGADGGVRGTGGLLEKDVTLGIARRLKAVLEGRIGGRVLLTRDDDRALGQDERAAFANNNKGDVFVSLHAAGASVGTLSGAAVYYLGLDSQPGEGDGASNGGAVAMPVFGGGTRTIDVIPWHMAQARHIDDSAALARRMEAQLRQSVPMSPRSLVQGPLRVLVGANMPAVLVEVGYLTNGAQETALGGAELQGRLAQSLAEAIVGFDSAQRSLATGATR